MKTTAWFPPAFLYAERPTHRRNDRETIPFSPITPEPRAYPDLLAIQLPANHNREITVGAHSSQMEIAKAHHAIAEELKVPVAPVGLAFQRSLAARPELPMLGRDKEHETIHGTYLAACVIHATLFGTIPVGLGYRPAGVSADEAKFLQRIAWETIVDWKKHRPFGN